MCNILFCNENFIVAEGYGGKLTLISCRTIVVDEDRQWSVKYRVEWEIAFFCGDVIIPTGGGGGRLESGSSNPAKDGYLLPAIRCMKQSSLRLGRGSGDTDEEFSICAGALGVDRLFHFSD